MQINQAKKYYNNWLKNIQQINELIKPTKIQITQIHNGRTKTQEAKVTLTEQD